MNAQEAAHAAVRARDHVRLHGEPCARRAGACLFKPQRQIVTDGGLAVQHAR